MHKSAFSIVLLVFLSVLSGSANAGLKGVSNGGGGGGGGSVSVSAATPDIVITPSPGTGTFTVGSTQLINAQGTAATYTIAATDMGKTVTHNKATAVAVTLPQAGTTGFGAGVSYSEVNVGAGTVTVTPTASTVNLNANLTLTTGQGAYFISDGANWVAFSGAASAGGSGTVASSTIGQVGVYTASTTVTGAAAMTYASGVLTLGTASSVLGSVVLSGSTSGTTTLNPNVTASGTLTLPAATDTLIGKATTDTLTNKTYDTAATGNSFKINGTAITAVTGTGAAVLEASPAITGTATAQIVNASKSVTTGVAALTVSGGAIATDASLGNHFRVTTAHSASTNMSAPTNPTDGQKITYELLQDSTGSGTIAWNAVFNFGSSGAPTLTTTANKRDLVGFVYSSDQVKWLYLGSQLQF